MAEKTVASLNAVFNVDAKKARNELGLTAREFNKLRREVKKLEPEEAKFAREQKELAAILKKSNLGLKEQNQLLARRRSELNRQKRIGALGSELGTMLGAGRFAAAGAAAGPLAVGAGAAALAARGARTLVGTADRADVIGASAGGLRGIQSAGARTGVSADKTSMALQRMARRIAEAAKGSGEAQEALRTLGLNAQQLAKLRADEQFMRIAEAMKQVDSNGEQLRLSFKLFDSEGAALVSTLRMSQQELETFRDAWGDLFSQEAIDNAREFEAAMETGKERLEQFTLAFANEFIPVMTAGIKMITGGDSTLGGKVARGAGGGLANMMFGTLGYANMVRQALPGLGAMAGRGMVGNRQASGMYSQFRNPQDAPMQGPATRPGGTNGAGFGGGFLQNALGMSLMATQMAANPEIAKLQERISLKQQQTTVTGRLKDLREETRVRVREAEKYNASRSVDSLAPTARAGGQELARAQQMAVARARFGGGKIDIGKIQEESLATEQAMLKTLEDIAKKLNPDRDEAQLEALTTLGGI